MFLLSYCVIIQLRQYRTKNGIALECTNLVTVNFGNGVKSIGANAFNGCTALSRFSIPDQVLSIGEYAFYKVPVENLVLGKNLESIGSYAFSECKLITVTMHNNVAVIGKGAFFKDRQDPLSRPQHQRRKPTPRFAAPVFCPQQKKPPRRLAGWSCFGIIRSRCSCVRAAPFDPSSGSSGSKRRFHTSRGCPLP